VEPSSDLVVVLVVDVLDVTVVVDPEVVVVVTVVVVVMVTLVVVVVGAGLQARQARTACFCPRAPSVQLQDARFLKFCRRQRFRSFRYSR
jgi:hypothetical protein